MSIEINEPISEREYNPSQQVKFEGTAKNSIVQVELWADDRWLIGTTNVENETWSFSYSFNTVGNRVIYAKGLDSSREVVDIDDIWVIINSQLGMGSELKLTNNFNLSEFTYSHTAMMNGVDNTPTSIEIQRLKQLCEVILQPARNALGPISINSGFRSERLNELVNGSPTSAHRLGYAADVVPTNGDTLALAKWVIDNCPFDQVILEFGTLSRPAWIHVSADPRNRSLVLRIDASGTRSISI